MKKVKETEVQVRSYTRKKAGKKKSAKKVADSQGILHEPHATPQKRMPIAEGVQIVSRNQQGNTKRTGAVNVSTTQGVKIYGRS